MATILNLTPHPVTVESSTGSWIYPPSGVVARVDMVTTDADPAPDGAPCVRPGWAGARLYVADERAELPVAEHADAYIVSDVFADVYRRQHGDDGVVLLVPDTGPSAVREDDQVVAVRQFIRR